MIWEYTWPAPRLIEPAFFDNPQVPEELDEEPEEPIEIVNLRLAGSLSTMLKEDLGSRILEDSPVEHCPDPVALQVCHQSRMHTLSRYRVIASLASPFYYHPQRDVIFFSVDFADDYDIHMPYLERYHETQLNTVETVLVMDAEWPDAPMEEEPRHRGMDYTLDCISHLGGLKTIQILWEKRSESEHVELMGFDDEEEEENPQSLAERLRLSFPDIIRHERCTAKWIEVMDSDGRLY